MEVLKPGIDIDSFFSNLALAKNRALLLDYDGTLAPFKIKRDKAHPYPGITEILEYIAESERCELAIISGRPVKEVISLLGLQRLPEIWGSHGWELMLPNGSYIAFELDKNALQGFNEAKDWISSHGYIDHSEFKHGSQALHWRGLEQIEVDKIQRDSIENWTPIANRYGLDIRNFDGGIELRAPGRNKGKAIANIIDRIKPDAVAYLGDDLTDEDAFKALGSAGLKVLVNTRKRPTSADLWLKPPGELLDFLKRWQKVIQMV